MSLGMIYPLVEESGYQPIVVISSEQSKLLINAVFLLGSYIIPPWISK